MITNYYVSLECQKVSNSLINFMPLSDYATVFTFKGVVNMASPSEVQTLGANGTKISHKLFSELVDIQHGDRIKQGSRVYEVVGDPKNTVNRNHHLKVWLYEIRQ